VLLIIMMKLRPEGFLPARRPALEKNTPPAEKTEAVSQPGKEV